ncbi:10410_t:CDS:10 [Gigaspora rosea]|nr:10410_t:CDS:10 [Gigaspora rosea]
MSRWTYPIVPDSNLQEGNSYEFMCGTFIKRKMFHYQGKKVLIGAGTVINRRVTIGSNVEIDGAYIWDDEYSVVIGFNVTLEPYTKLTKHKKTSESDNKGEESNENEAYDSTLIGENGQGYIWSDEASDTDDEFGTKNIKVAGLDELSDFDESTTEEESLKEFFKEVSQTLERAFFGHTVEIALNTLRIASNTTFHDLRVGWGPLNGKLIHSRQDKIDTLYILQDHYAILEWNSSDDDPSKSSGVFCKMIGRS